MPVAMPFGTLWLPCVVSAVVVWIASALAHMVLKHHKADYRGLPNEEAFAEPMRKMALTPGVYVHPHCPDLSAMKDPAVQARYAKGPVALISVLPTGVPNMGKHLSLWLGFCLLVSFISAYIARHTLPLDADGLDVMQITGTVAWAGYAMGRPAGHDLARSAGGEYRARHGRCHRLRRPHRPRVPPAVAVNRGYTYTLELPREAAGRRLASFLSERYRHSTLAEWEGRIASGRVLLDGGPVDGAVPVRPGQTLTWQRPPWIEPEAPESFAVLYRDADLLAVAKPAGLPTLPGAGFLERTLLSLVRTFDAEASPLHRLGRFTSGIVLFARTHEARENLVRQWVERSVGKRYRALATGTPEHAAFTVDRPHRTGAASVARNGPPALPRRPRFAERGPGARAA